MTDRRTTTAGVVTLALFLGAVLFGFNALHGSPLTSRKTVEAAFDDVGGLTVGDDVRISSVRVGYVDELRIENGHALAVLKMDDGDRPVYADATAAVIDRSALGQKFVNLDPGTERTGPLKQAISIGATQRAQDLNQLFDTFDEPTRDAAGSTLRELGGGMTGHAQDLHDLVGAAPDVLEDTANIAKTLSDDGGDPLVRLMDSTDALVTRFHGREDDVADLMRQFGTTLEAVGVDEGDPLRQTIAQAPDTLEAATSALDSLRQPLKDTGTAMTTLRPGAEALGKATPDLRGFLRESVTPLTKVPGVNRQAEPALTSLTALVEDARPLARQLIATGDGAATPVSIFSGYTDEIVRYFVFGKSALGYQDTTGHYTRILAMPSDESLGGLPGVLPVNRNPYPSPGVTDQGGR